MLLSSLVPAENAIRPDRQIRRGISGSVLCANPGHADAVGRSNGEPTAPLKRELQIRAPAEAGTPNSSRCAEFRLQAALFPPSRTSSLPTCHWASVGVREAGVRPVAHGVSRGDGRRAALSPSGAKASLLSPVPRAFVLSCPSNPRLTPWAKLLKAVSRPWHGHPARDRTRPRWPCHEVKRRRGGTERGRVDFFRRPACRPAL